MVRRLSTVLLLAGWACSGDLSGTSGSGGQGAGIAGGGGTPGSGGAARASGGASPGSGGTTASGGAPMASGGASPPGGISGGAGGAPGSGGRSAGGASGVGGASGAVGTAFTASYFIGADISRVQTDPPGTLYTDSDGTRKELLALLKGHGFNYIRVRTFVDPRAADGNDRTNGFYDIAHTVAFGKRIKDAGMGFLLDFHYSDNWADPAKQCVPIAWQGFTSIAQLTTAVHDYTRDAITQLVSGGARPDMVQIGNEITPGMLIHRCDAAGIPIAGTINPVTGRTSNWNDLGLLLKGAAQGIKDVDTDIKIMLHIERAQDFASSRSFIMNALAQGVPFDVFGESSYTLYQGPPAGWLATFTQLAAAFPKLKFVSAEYGPEQRAINDILFNLPNQQGLGTFYWEATHSGADNAGHLLFSNRVAQPDLLLYDLMKNTYANRL